MWKREAPFSLDVHVCLFESSAVSVPLRVRCAIKVHVHDYGHTPSSRTPEITNTVCRCKGVGRQNSKLGYHSVSQITTFFPRRPK